MPRVAISRQQVSDIGVRVVYSPAVEEGHKVENSGGKLLLHVRNYGEKDVVVTIRTGYTVSGLKLEDRCIEVPAGDERFIGPLNPQVYNRPDSSEVWLDYSETEYVEIAALLIP